MSEKSRKHKAQNLVVSTIRAVLETAKLVVTNVTIEPALFCLSVARSLEFIPTKEMLLYKTCIRDFGFPEEVCSDLLNDNYTDYNGEVQDEVARLNSGISVVVL